MTYESFNNFCRSLQAVSYVIQWGDSHVWKVGGKVFAIGGWEHADKPAFTFKASESDFLFLSEIANLYPLVHKISLGQNRHECAR